MASDSFPEFYELWDELTGSFLGEFPTREAAFAQRAALAAENPSYPALTQDLAVYWYRSDGTCQIVEMALDA